MCSNPWFSQRNGRGVGDEGLGERVGRRVGVETVERQRQLVVVGLFPVDGKGDVVGSHAHATSSGAVQSSPGVQLRSVFQLASELKASSTLNVKLLRL